MSANVIDIWAEPHGGRIRIPGPGEQFAEPGTVTVLPVLRTERRRAKPAAAPRRRTRHLEEDDEREAIVGPGEEKSGPASS